MTDNLDFYDCNSSSNSLLKFDITEIEVDIAEEISSSPSGTVEVINFEGQMNTMSNNNPLLSTASITIPSRNFSGSINTSNNTRLLNDLSDIVFCEFDPKSQLSMNESNNFGFKPNQIINNNDGLYEMQTNAFNNSSGTNWELNAIMNSANMMITDPGFQMDEDDIFQVDKSDLIQGPTLAELNGDNLYKDLLNMEEMLTSESSAQIIPTQINQNQFTQLTTANFHNLQNAIESNANCMEIPQQMFHTINVPQTPHNTPSTSFLSGNNIIFYDDQQSNSPYEVYSPSNTVPTSSLTINTIRMNANQPTAGQIAALSPGSHSSTSTSSVLLNSSLSPPPSLPQQNSFPSHPTVAWHSPQSQRSAGVVQHNPKFTTLHELLLKKEHIALSPEGKNPSSPPSQLLNNSASLSPSGLSSLSRRLNMSGGTAVSRLSSSAPSNSGLESIWQRREPRQHLLSTGSLAEAGSTSSLSGVLSPEAADLSQDEAYSDDDSDHYEDLSSDSDNEDNKDASLGSMNDSNNNANFKGMSKKNRYFWQYNVQAKGPKGQRLVIKTQIEDPHVLNEATDPVFSPSCSVRGIKHSGKARKGDGNDLTPNARKLNSIGKELDKLSRIINDMTPVSELPVNVRPKTRKEKNKLASRACRLKKKAQHEANKIKLFGLEHEHKRLINGIAEMKHLLAMKCSNGKEKQEEINQRMEQVVAKATVIKIAENSTEYVNRVLDRIKAGIPNGGLEDF